ASQAELTEAVVVHLRGLLVHGITTAEAKTGYGLSSADEHKSLLALNAAIAEVPLTVKRTFMGAHEFPPEYRDDREAYVRLLTEQMIPQAAPLCDYCDVFAEPGVFDRLQALRIL